MRPIALAVPALLLAGCAFDASGQRAAALNATIGMDEATLVRTVGVPSRAIETGGHRFLAYADRRVDYLPGFGGGGFGGFSGYGGFGGFGGFGPFGYEDVGPPIVVQRVCETTYELDAGRVIGWSLRGNACGSAAGVGVPMIVPAPPVPALVAPAPAPAPFLPVPPPKP